MHQIRKRSLKATVWIYIGFLIGALNTYFLTHENWFTPDQNGLTRAMIDISMLIFAFSTLGVTTYLFKFFPYYKDNIEQKKNDLLGIAVLVSGTGFLLTSLGMFFIKPLIVQKFSEKSALLVEYIYWCIPMACFVLMYTVLESYAYGFHKGVLTSMLRETILRLYTCVIIVLKVLGLIDFDTFVILFSLQFAVITMILLIHLKIHDQLWLTFKFSRVTYKFRKKIYSVMGLTAIVLIVSVLRTSIDALVLAARENLRTVAVFGAASYLVSVMQAPYRSLIAVTIPILANSWKDKNIKEINRIYRRSSINLLSFALLIFFSIWLNYDHLVMYFGINPVYLEGKWVFFLLGMVAIVELGTGVNAQIIGTSVYWRFELWTSILLTLMIIPLSYILTVKYGIMGPAFASLVSFVIYNYIRFHFLWKKFNMQPFTRKTIEVILIAVGAYFTSHFLLIKLEGLTAIILRPLLFLGIYLPLLYQLNISPDFKPVVQSLRNKLKRS